MTPVFGHGQLRLYLLSLLDEAPRHGYELIRALEDRFNGMYTPSAGTIYPRLARLEEEGLVERQESGRKAVYRITEAGRAEVRARAEELRDLDDDLTASAQRLASQVREQVRAASRDLRGELAAAAKAAKAASRTATSQAGQPWDVGPQRGDVGAARRAEATLERFRHTVIRELHARGIADERLTDLEHLLRETETRVRSLLG
ncbi:MAG TPA: helix-turn-helix transcriptional regulator [Actinomycetales bacterium]|nr:helix-turn-helix transcriptional regulator [Actinomycetales bacterium]